MADSAGGGDRGRERPPTIVNVARRAAVSIATVSRVVTTATAVLQVVRASGRRVPDDIAVVGFDDSPPAVMTTPALTTVYQPVEDLAKLAVRTLINPTPERPLDQRLPTNLVVRASSAA